MFNLRNKGWVKNYVINRGRSRSMINIPFTDKVIVSQEYPYPIGSLGEYLNLQASTSAIIIAPDGQQYQYDIGGLLNLPKGRYRIFYVDRHIRHSRFLNIKSKSSDNWSVTLSIDVTWQIGDPKVVLNMLNPITNMETLVDAALKNYIKTKLHDGLVPVPKVAAIGEGDITKVILEQLRTNPALKGFQFQNINILDRQGDPERINLLRTKSLQSTEYQQDLQLQNEKLEYELTVAKRELAILKEREQIPVQAAKTERLVKEEEARVIVTQADFQSQVAEILRPVLLQNVELQQRSNMQQLQQNQVIKAMEISGEAISKLAGILMQAQLIPGLQHGLDNRTIEMLTQTLDSLSRLVPTVTIGAAPTDTLPVVNMRNPK
jgi:hypothetical protein